MGRFAQHDSRLAGGLGAGTTGLPLSTSMSLDVVDVVRETRTTGRTKTRIGGWI